MRKFACLLLAFLLVGCGYSSRDNELVGQAKRLSNRTPVLCPDYLAFEVSMGVMHNGTGSISAEDVWFSVRDQRLAAILEKAVLSGSIVHVKYNDIRFSYCKASYELTDVSIEDSK